MKKYLLAVLLLAGCQEKGTNRIEINGQVIEGENIVMYSNINDTLYRTIILHDTITLHDSIIIYDTIHHFYYKAPSYNVEAHGDNSPAIISDKPVNIKY